MSVFSGVSMASRHDVLRAFPGHLKRSAFLGVWKSQISQCVSAFAGSTFTGTSQWASQFLFFWCSWISINTILCRSNSSHGGAVRNTETCWDIWSLQTSRKMFRGHLWNAELGHRGNTEKNAPRSSASSLRILCCGKFCIVCCRVLNCAILCGKVCSTKKKRRKIGYQSIWLTQPIEAASENFFTWYVFANCLRWMICSYSCFVGAKSSRNWFELKFLSPTGQNGKVACLLQLFLTGVKPEMAHMLDQKQYVISLDRTCYLQVIITRHTLHRVTFSTSHTVCLGVVFLWSAPAFYNAVIAGVHHTCIKLLTPPCSANNLKLCDRPVEWCKSWPELHNKFDFHCQLCKRLLGKNVIMQEISDYTILPSIGSFSRNRIEIGALTMGYGYGTGNGPAKCLPAQNMKSRTPFAKVPVQSCNTNRRAILVLCLIKQFQTLTP